MKKIVLLLFSSVLLLAACNAQEMDETDAGEEPVVISEETDSPDVLALGDDDADMEQLAEMIALAEEMIDFLNQGLDKANDYDLNMEMMDYKVCNNIMNYVYANYTYSGDGYAYEDDNEEFEIYTITRVSKNGRVYNFNNIAYDYEQRDVETVITDTTFYAEKNLVVHIGTIKEPQSKSIDKYYMSDDGKLIIVGAQLYKTTLYIDVLYYDGSFIGIARTYYDNQNELRIPYDLEQMQPSSFEELLTESSYQTYFTYDGTDVHLQ